jgi:hypothetical protein
MALPQKPVRRALRLVQLGMAFGLLSLLCQILIARPFALVFWDSHSRWAIAAQFFLGNFAFLIGTPLLVSAAAFAIEISPRRLAAIAQVFVLLALWVPMQIASGGQSTSFFLGGAWLVAGTIGVLLSGFGYNNIAAWLSRRRAAVATVTNPAPELGGPVPPLSAPTLAEPTQKENSAPPTDALPELTGTAPPAKPSSS